MSFANMTGIIPTEYRVLIKPDPVEEKTAGGIIIPERQKDREQAGTQTGTVVASGGNAFSDWKDERTPQPGDRVVYQKYAGMTFDSGGVEYRIMDDKEVAALLA